MALNSLFCADVPLSNYSLTHTESTASSGKDLPFTQKLAAYSQWFHSVKSELQYLQQCISISQSAPDIGLIIIIITRLRIVASSSIVQRCSIARYKTMVFNSSNGNDAIFNVMHSAPRELMGGHITTHRC